MNRIQTLLLLIIGINTASPAGLPNKWEQEKRDLASLADLIEALAGPDAATDFITVVTGNTPENIQRAFSAAVIMLGHKGPGLEEHLRQRADARKTPEGLEGLERPDAKILQYLEKHNDQPPSTDWLNKNLWMSYKLYNRTCALEIIKQHSLQSERAAKYLAKYKEAQEAHQPMKGFKAPLDKIATYLNENNNEAPSKDWLDQHLWR
ncbi:MAG: hypothetical protein LVQ75_02890 [Candidatus Babeliales bacterium]